MTVKTTMKRVIQLFAKHRTTRCGFHLFFSSVNEDYRSKNWSILRFIFLFNNNLLHFCKLIYILGRLWTTCRRLHQFNLVTIGNLFFLCLVSLIFCPPWLVLRIGIRYQIFTSTSKVWSSLWLYNQPIEWKDFQFRL